MLSRFGAFLITAILMSSASAEVPFFPRDQEKIPQVAGSNENFRALSDVAHQKKENHWVGVNVFESAPTFTATGGDTYSMIASSGISGAVLEISGTGRFTGTTSTVTFSGWIDVGFTIQVANNGTVNTSNVGCPAGTFVTGGGCTTSGAGYQLSAPSNNRTDGTTCGNPADGGQGVGWCCQTTGAATADFTAYAICARFKQ